MNKLRPCWIIAKNSLRESVRDRLYSVLVFISAIMMLLSLVLGQMTFAEQKRILADLGFFAIHIVMLGLAIFLGSFNIFREIEKQTYTTVLVRPLSRAQFILGKYLGLAITLFLTVYSLTIVLNVLLADTSVTQALLTIAFGIVLEGWVLLACAFFFSTFLRPVVALFTVFAIFILGQSLEDLAFFAKKSGAAVFIGFSDFMNYATPHLFQMNWRQYLLVESGVDTDLVYRAAFHAITWTCLLLIATVIVFRRKDLV